MEFKDYYQIMGLPRDATQEAVKRAYRKLARKYHPDVSEESDAETRFKEIGEAYEVLKDPEKRAAYDQLGQDWRAGQEFRPPPDWQGGFEFHSGGFTDADSSAFSDFFETLFGRGFARHGGGERGFSARGEDSYAKVMIDLEDAYRGAVRSFTLTDSEVDAQGRVQRRQRTLNVRIPKGVKRGQHIRLAGQGGPGIGGGARGDLFLEIEFRPHPYYHVEGRDVFLDLPVAPWEAALGATVKAPTPDGAVDLKIPAGSGSGRKLRLKARGIPSDPPGDLFVVLQIALPAAENDEVRAAYKALEQVAAFDPRARLGV